MWLIFFEYMERIREITESVANLAGREDREALHPDSSLAAAFRLTNH